MVEGRFNGGNDFESNHVDGGDGRRHDRKRCTGFPRLDRARGQANVPRNHLARTYDTIGRPLPGRKNVVLTRNPQRVSESPDLVFTDKEPQQLLADLEKEGYTQAVLAGGSVVNYLFASQGLIDELFITYVPKTFGAGVPLFAGKVTLDLELVSQKTLGEGRIQVRYRVVGPPRT